MVSWQFTYLAILVPEKAKSGSCQNKKLPTLKSLKDSTAGEVVGKLRWYCPGGTGLSSGLDTLRVFTKLDTGLSEPRLLID